MTGLCGCIVVRRCGQCTARGCPVPLREDDFVSVYTCVHVQYCIYGYLGIHICLLK